MAAADTTMAGAGADQDAYLDDAAPEPARRGWVVRLLPRWLRALALPPVREAFLRQVYFTGIQASPSILLRGAGVGTLIILYMIRVLNADVAVTTKILVLFVFREVGPLFAALLVIFRSGSAATSELALMNVSGELRTMRLLGMRVWDCMVLPRLAGITVATVALTIYFQVVAVAGGFLLAPLVIDATLTQLLNEFLGVASLWDIGYSLVKSAAFGLIIALVSCNQGLRLPRQELGAVPQAVTRAIMQSFGLVTLFNAVFAYFVFGVLLFGIIKAGA